MSGESNGTIAVSWIFKAGVWVLSMVTAGLLAYGAARSDIEVLKTEQQENKRRLETIERAVTPIPAIEAKLNILLQRQP